MEEAYEAREAVRFAIGEICSQVISCDAGCPFFTTTIPAFMCKAGNVESEDFDEALDELVFSILGY